MIYKGDKIIVELLRLGDKEILNILENDYKNILEYKISRTNDKRLILEIKMDISQSTLELAVGTIEEKNVRE